MYDNLPEDGDSELSGQGFPCMTIFIV
jgi:hypothetical protein